MSMITYYLRKLVPRPLVLLVRPLYHYTLTTIAAIWYRFPSRHITVIGVTGTKGKSTVTELINALFEADGKRTAVAGTIRFKIGEASEPNLYKMTMPGRFFVQRFLRRAVDAGCSVVILEMTSEGVKQYRHKWIELDALVFTNLTPEHIESHGSFEKYIAAKFELAKQLERSKKRPRTMVANVDDARGALFLSINTEKRVPYTLKEAELYNLKRDGISLVYRGVTMRLPIAGIFNVMNALAAIKTAEAFGISLRTIEAGFAALLPIHGRVEQFSSPKDAKRQVTAVVDYAHTPDSLTKLYEAFPKEHKVCILGNTGGGRDTWKRPEMGKIAGDHCDRVILTNEDPYDEDPHAIVEAMQRGVRDQDQYKVSIIMDRRFAIRTALYEAPDGAVVLISGKGTDPYIMGPRGSKVPWSDAEVVKEELAKLPLVR
jgi:UDP-N-acetylmuramoyl-L-alanyl-D-glutamate--2,6-diaminopimelate ligase